MNREIKFRIWDKKNNKFLVNIHNGIDEFNFDLWDWAEQMSSCLSFPIDSYVFQQYTGLKTENGVEIYEGDILKNLTPHKYSPDTFVVEWDEFHPSDDMGVGGVGFVLPWFCCTFKPKVIGNIFENPELFTKS